MASSASSKSRHLALEGFSTKIYYVSTDLLQRFTTKMYYVSMLRGPRPRAGACRRRPDTGGGGAGGCGSRLFSSSESRRRRPGWRRGDSLGPVAGLAKAGLRGLAASRGWPAGPRPRYPPRPADTVPGGPGAGLRTRAPQDTATAVTAATPVTAHAAGALEPVSETHKVRLHPLTRPSPHRCTPVAVDL